LSGTPSAASLRFARSLGLKLLETLDKVSVLCALESWTLGPHPIQVFDLYRVFFLYKTFDILFPTNEKSKVMALGNLSATFEVRV
jgi:hypothetical protein